MARTGLSSLRQKPTGGWVFDDLEGAARELLAAIPGFEPGAILMAVTPDFDEDATEIPEPEIRWVTLEQIEGEPIEEETEQEQESQAPVSGDQGSDPSSTTGDAVQVADEAQVEAQTGSEPASTDEHDTEPAKPAETPAEPAKTRKR